MASRKAFLTVMTAAATMAAVAGLTITAASPAQADDLACIGYLTGEGYVLTSARADACLKGASGQAGSWFLCYDAMRATGVASGVASSSCQRAAW
jgi:hypothetical protein